MVRVIKQPVKIRKYPGFSRHLASQTYAAWMITEE